MLTIDLNRISRISTQGLREQNIACLMLKPYRGRLFSSMT